MNASHPEVDKDERRIGIAVRVAGMFVDDTLVIRDVAVKKIGESETSATSAGE